MLGLELPRRARNPIRVLCLGAHSDDIEIGCGGTLQHLLESRPVALDWVVFSGNPVRAREARASARALAKGARSLWLATKRFRDGFFPSQSARIKEEFERLKRRPSPDVVFCPRREDAHQDHRVVAELTWNTFRDHLIFEYEVPKYDGDPASPNVYVPLDQAGCERKVAHIRRFFPSQKGNQWMSDDTFRAVLRLRGIECNARYAEGFTCRKVVVSPTDRRRDAAEPARR
jgi:LmbE family N-acetylglucosaminyl deacetylase